MWKKYNGRIKNSNGKYVVCIEIDDKYGKMLWVVCYSMGSLSNKSVDFTSVESDTRIALVRCFWNSCGTNVA